MGRHMLTGLMTTLLTNMLLTGKWVTHGMLLVKLLLLGMQQVTRVVLTRVWQASIVLAGVKITGVGVGVAGAVGPSAPGLLLGGGKMFMLSIIRISCLLDLGPIRIACLIVHALLAISWTAVPAMTCSAGVTRVWFRIHCLIS